MVAFGLCWQIEHDTFGKLQCHPYPHEYVDTSRQCGHCAFFMGLQRKQGEIVQEGQQFDIRGTVEGFRHSVNMYMFWKPGMDIYVSHVRRRQIPSYVFADDYKRSRPLRPTAQLQYPHKSFSEAEVFGTEHGERNHKRKYDDGVGMKQEVVVVKRSTSPQGQDSIASDIFYKSIDNLARSNMSQFEVSQVQCLGSSDFSGDSQELRNVKCVNLSNRVQDELTAVRQSPEPEAECASNSSVITSIADDGSPAEDIRSGMMAGRSEDNTKGVEGMDDDRFQNTTYGTHSVTLVEKEMASGNEVLQEELLEQVEVLTFNFFRIYNSCLIFFYHNLFALLLFCWHT